MMVTNALVDVAIAMQSATFSSRRHYPAMSRLSGLYSLGTVGGAVVATAIVAAGFDVSVHLLLLAVALAIALVFVSPGLLPAVLVVATKSAHAAAASARRRARFIAAPPGAAPGAR